MKTVGHIPNKLPGRHRCECQARVHALISNCLGCGRIVCEQEGSGPCVFCGKFVCTREQRQIIQNDKRNGLALERKLMQSAGYGSDLSRIKQEEEAQKYRDMLLKADRESVIRNRVLDLESDYYNLEMGHYLNAEERKAIEKRKEELKHVKSNRARRAMVMDIDFANATVSEQKLDMSIEKVEDEVIQKILERAEARRMRQKYDCYEHRGAHLPTAEKFNAKYTAKVDAPAIPTSDEYDLEDLVIADKDQLYAEVERKGFCLAVDQPVADLILTNRRCFLSSDEEVTIQGPVYLCALKNTDLSQKNLTEYAIIGTVVITNCITAAELHEDSPDVQLDNEDAIYVLILDLPTPLDTPVPYVPKPGFHQLPKAMRDIMKTGV